MVLSIRTIWSPVTWMFFVRVAQPPIRYGTVHKMPRTDSIKTTYSSHRWRVWAVSGILTGKKNVPSNWSWLVQLILPREHHSSTQRMVPGNKSGPNEWIINHCRPLWTTIWPPYLANILTRFNHDLCHYSPLLPSCKRLKFTVCELDNGPVEIVDIAMKHGDFPVRFVNVYQRVCPQGQPQALALPHCFISHYEPHDENHY